MAAATSILGVLAENFIGFDFIIFLLAAANIFILTRTIYYSKKLYATLNPYCWIPGGKESLNEVRNKFKKQENLASETDIILLRRKMNAYYVVYENLTAIFPLLGLLGTVVSLLPMVEDMGEIMTGLFFSALTSTMWGIIFAIVFKTLNGYLSSGIEDNEKNIEIYLQRNTDRLFRESEVMTAENAVMTAETAVMAAAEAAVTEEKDAAGLKEETSRTDETSEE